MASQRNLNPTGIPVATATEIAIYRAVSYSATAGATLGKAVYPPAGAVVAGISQVASSSTEDRRLILAPLDGRSIVKVETDGSTIAVGVTVISDRSGRATVTGKGNGTRILGTALEASSSAGSIIMIDTAGANSFASNS